MSHSISRPVAAFLILLFSVLSAAAVSAREIPETQPGRVGLDSERLARIADYMNQAVADGTMVGGLGMIARNGRLAYSETWASIRKSVYGPVPACAFSSALLPSSGAGRCQSARRYGMMMTPRHKPDAQLPGGRNQRMAIPVGTNKARKNRKAAS